MRPARFRSLDDVERALAAPEFVLFKHSTICPESADAFAEYAAFHAAHPDVPTAWIDVIEQRPWSQRVAAATGIAHASPQAIVVRDGRPVWNASHRDVTRQAIETALGMPSGLGGG